MSPEPKSLKQKAIHEVKEFVWLSLYLFIFLSTFVAYKSIILREEGIDFVAHGVAIINALVLAKFMLIAKAFHPGEQANDAPLIYPTMLKAALFAVIVAILKVIEVACVGYFHGKSLIESITDLGGGSWKGILIFTVILFVVLLPLTAFGELERVVGEGKIGALFVRRRDLSKPFGQPVA